MSRSTALLLLGGLSLGLAGLSPAAWPLAWLGVAATAAGLSIPAPLPRMLAALAVGVSITRVIWFAWSLPMAAAMLPDAPGLHVLVGVGFVVVVTLPVLVLTALGAATFGERGVPFWLPVAWAVGERLQTGWTSVGSDWLFTQVDLPPIMAALGRYGAVPTVLGCLFVAASAGVGVAHRDRRLGLAAAPVLVALLVAPPLPSDTRVLEGVGVVHLDRLTAVPAVDTVDHGLDLLVWPEASFAARPVVGEGPVTDARLEPPPGSPRTSHLAGVLTPPRYGQQNVVLAVAPDGRIDAARAKRVLFPFFERRFLGLGEARYVEGLAAPLLRVAGRAVVPLICGELLTPGLVAEGRAAGGELLAVLASDRYQARLAQPRWQVLAHLRLRAIESGLPAVYASLEGRAAIVAPDGRVLAESAAGAPSGVLTWSEARGAEDRIPTLRPEIVVLASAATPWLRPDCAPGRCVYQDLEGLDCDHAAPAPTVVVAGHADAQTLLGRSPDEVAAAVACFRPELVVLDACYGASTPVLSAVARHTGARVVASTALVDGQGFRYGPAFFGDGPVDERAAGVGTDPPTPLFVGSPSVEGLAAVERQVADTPPDALRPRLVSWSPTLVGAPFEGQQVLVPVDWRRFDRPTRTFEVRALWLEGAGEEDREELDRFLACLLDGSNFTSFWQAPEVVVRGGGSWVVPAPPGPIGVDDPSWLEPLVAGLPPVDDGVTPIWLVYVGAESMLRPVCGQCEAVPVGGRDAAVALVRTRPGCWPGQGAVRNLTQYTQHELSCAIERALGEDHCAADGACQGDAGCGGGCDAFTGLWCPGAPEQSYTGCDGNPVRGWVVQTLTSAGQGTEDCPACAACDFTVRETDP